LEQALRELQAESLHWESHAENNATATASSVVEEQSTTSQSELGDMLPLDDSMVEQIMKSFGEAIAESQRTRADGDSRTGGPAALLRGRLDHFNRLNTKWRLIVHDAEIRPRAPLDKNRRKRERPSLWQISEEKYPTRQGAPPPAKCTLEILAYNDLS
jgi:hypothetical protein